MISVTHLRQGATFLKNGVPHRVLQYSHTHMGRGGGSIKVKVQNMRTGATLTQTFKSGEKVEDISVAKKQMQYLYEDSGSLVLMDPRSYAQFEIPLSVLGDKINYLMAGADVWALIWEKEEDEVLDIDLPPKVVMTVKEAAPGDKGNTAANSFKEGVLENGVRIKLPLFVNVGDKVKISTQDGSYVERA